MYTKEKAEEYRVFANRLAYSQLISAEDYSKIRKHLIKYTTEKAKLHVTVKVEGLDILRKTLENYAGEPPDIYWVDGQPIIGWIARLKAKEPKPCPFCGEKPEVDKGLVRCSTKDCPASDWFSCGKWHNRGVWNRRAQE